MFSTSIQSGSWQSQERVDELAFPQFTQLPLELQGRIVTWLDAKDGYQLFTTSKWAYCTLQGLFLAGRAGREWFVGAAVKKSACHFDKAACLIEKRVAVLDKNTCFQGLFVRLLERRWSCTHASMTDVGLAIVAKGGGAGVHRICLEHENVCGEGFSAIAEHCTGLTSLAFSGMARMGLESFSALMSHRGKQLERLYLSSMTLSCVHCLAIAQYCPNLKELNFSGCLGVDNVGIETIIDACKTNLVRLALLGTGISDRVVSTIALCKNLEVLEINGGGMITDVGLIPIMERCMALKRLDLNGCTHFSGSCFTVLPEERTSFTHVNLVECTGMTSENLEIVIRRSAHLVSLNLRGVLTARAAAAAVARHTLQLEFLDLGGCLDLTDADIAAVALHCTHLKSISLGGCKDITDEAVCCLAKYCPHLTEIDLSVTAVSDAALIALAARCPQLKKLRLAGCTITGAGLGPLLMACKNLHSLVLCHTTIVDADLDVIAAHGDHLEHIGFGPTHPHLTKAAICRLQKSLPNVEFT